MNREEAREKWEVIKAYGEGKIIQFFGASGEWFDVEEGFELPIREKLRIKPEEEKSERDNDLCSAKEHGKKWVDNYEEYQNACNTHTETYTTSNGMIGIVR